MPVDTAGLGSSPFARRYWGNRSYFLFLRVIRCFSSPRSPHAMRDVGIAPDGLPHSDIRRSKGICPSLRLFAACHVLLRLREPRHPPCALIKLRFSLTDPFFIHMSRLFITFASYIGDGARLLYSFFVSLATARCIFPEPRFHDVIVLSFR